MRQRKNIATHGVCKLTLKKGKYVESHILPRALTILNRTGEKAIQKEEGFPGKPRFQGWYDNQICISDGEKILRDIDTKAIKTLRKNHLVWSGWPTMLHSLSDNEITIDEENGIGWRIIAGLDWKSLKLFFLSILWRAAASEREDMKYVSLSTDTIEKIRIALIQKDPLPFNEFPIRLYQIVTRGTPHNRTPIIEDLVFSVPPSQPRTYKVCRIYIDGLIAHITLNPDKHLIDTLKGFFLGSSDQTFIVAHRFESSRSFDNLISAMTS
ncbi:hypothetical protein NUBL7079_39340 [Klebsiella pneumoniae]|nr:hypothetical protein [Klebsiella pneumoniae]HDU4406209.1 hypothetical protein [Klebsiella pneumoniae subsp. pneumoniae]GKI99498.1 hypothetical protein NUBL6723_05880 [Klebsiella pneumoniae]GKJ35061.1 hypothetical protein NUBL7079_39340 [Klebsiella pneumoniae]GKK72674.1 hypothetical protein NUBL13796_01400 [Klebsiella pneumoniae]